MLHTRLLLAMAGLWFVTEALARRCFGGPRRDGLASSAVCLAHAVAATAGALCFFAWYGFLPDETRIEPCWDDDAADLSSGEPPSHPHALLYSSLSVPSTYPHALLHFSLSWAVWDFLAVLRNLSEHGGAMVLHSLIMITSMSAVLHNGYQVHMMASLLIMEASTCFLKPMRMMEQAWGAAAARSLRSYQLCKLLFALCFFAVRLGAMNVRVAVHFLPTVRRYHAGALRGRGDGPACRGFALAAVDVLLVSLQQCLNAYWGFLIARGAARQFVKRGDARKKQ